MIDQPTFWGFDFGLAFVRLTLAISRLLLRFRPVRWVQLCLLCLASGRDADATAFARSFQIGGPGISSLAAELSTER
jgi:hypothetical protein